jgi:hypothetical protein
MILKKMMVKAMAIAVVSTINRNPSVAQAIQILP